MPVSTVSALVHPSYKWTLALLSLLITGATSNLQSRVSHQVGWYGRFMINIGTHVCLISTLIHHQFQDTMWGYYSIGKFNENYVGFKRHVSDAGHGSPIANRWFGTENCDLCLHACIYAWMHAWMYVCICTCMHINYHHIFIPSNILYYHILSSYIYVYAC